MTIYDTARELRVSSVVVTAHIDPNKMTARMRSLIKKTIMTGNSGGYYSDSALLARKIINGVPLSSFKQHWYGHYKFKISRRLNDDELALAKELFGTDHLLSRANGESKTSFVEQNLTELNECYKDADGFYAGHVRIYNKSIEKEVMNLLLSTRSKEEIELAKSIASKLDSNDLIPMTITI